MPLASRRPCPVPALVVAFLGLFGAEARAANGDLLKSAAPVPDRELGGICADVDGTFWAAGESTGKIYHLDASLAKIGEMSNPHGTGVFPNVVVTRGIAFRPSTQTLFILAKGGGLFKVKEVDRTGVEVTDGAFTIDVSTLSSPNFYGLAYDAASDQVWTVDDANDQAVRVTLKGVVLNNVSFPGDIPPETTIRGTGIALAQEGAIPFVYVTYGDIFTLAPSRILQLTLSGVPTGVEIPLSQVPPTDQGTPVKKVAGLLVGTFGGIKMAIVIGEKGAIHELAFAPPDPIPPTFFRAFSDIEGHIILTWVNHGSIGGSYPGGISIYRNNLPLASIGGGKTTFTDTAPPLDGEVTYTIKGSNGESFSFPVTIKAVAGKGALIRWIPFPGGEPYDATHDPATGDIFVTDMKSPRIFHFDGDLNLLGTIPSPFPAPGAIAFVPASATMLEDTLMVVQSDGTLMQRIRPTGEAIDSNIPIETGDIATPRIGGMVWNADLVPPAFVAIEASTHQLITFDKNGRSKGVCLPVVIGTSDEVDEGVAYDHFTGNHHATFSTGTVRELYSNCTPTNFSFGLEALGETIVLPHFVRGIDVIENTLLVCGGASNALFQVLISPRGDEFVRGDIDADATITLTDVIRIAEFLFRAGQAPTCLDAADANDDGEIDLSDPVYLIFYMFVGGSRPPAPFPAAGTDPTYLDDIGC